jgi:acyl-CoA reductase-like NAD-dependent aldehyde dehydrogenase
MPNYKMFISGEWVAAESGEWFETFGPYTGQPWAMIGVRTAIADVVARQRKVSARLASM